MPEIEKVKKGAELGYKNKYKKHVWQACPICGKERWVCIDRSNPPPMCQVCKAHKQGQLLRYDKSPMWKGGRWSDGRGYIVIRLYPNDPFISTARKSGLIYEHRLVVARHLGRPLLKAEKVHHLNGIKGDNRVENLELMPDINIHNKKYACAHCGLRKEIRLLQWQIKELTQVLQYKLEGEKEC